jgi:hypothetical protein
MPASKRAIPVRRVFMFAWKTDEVSTLTGYRTALLTYETRQNNEDFIVTIPPR